MVADRDGQGRALILIGGAFNDRSTVASLGAELAGDFRIFTYDRRGRVGSDDKSPQGQYAVADEVALFLRTYVGVPEELLAKMQGTPGWTFMTERASTLPYDVLLCSPSEPMPAARLAAVTQPLLAVYGDRTAPSLSAATRAVAEAVPGAELVAIEGEDHAVLERAGVLAPILARFFA